MANLFTEEEEEKQEWIKSGDLPHRGESSVLQDWFPLDAKGGR